MVLGLAVVLEIIIVVLVVVALGQTTGGEIVPGGKEVLPGDPVHHSPLQFVVHRSSELHQWSSSRQLSHIQ